MRSTVDSAQILPSTMSGGPAAIVCPGMKDDPFVDATPAPTPTRARVPGSALVPPAKTAGPTPSAPLGTAGSADGSAKRDVRVIDYASVAGGKVAEWTRGPSIRTSTSPGGWMST